MSANNVPQSDCATQREFDDGNIPLPGEDLPGLLQYLHCWTWTGIGPAMKKIFRYCVFTILCERAMMRYGSPPIVNSQTTSTSMPGPHFGPPDTLASKS